MNKLLWSSVLLVLSSCSFIAHDENMAAKSAIDFSRMALISNDQHGAYNSASNEMRKLANFDQYSEMIKKMHPSGFPLSIKATEFEPIPGQKMMNIYLEGENGSEKFYYRLVMFGTKQTGYECSGMFRGNQPYPTSKLRKSLGNAYSS